MAICAADAATPPAPADQSASSSPTLSLSAAHLGRVFVERIQDVLSAPSHVPSAVVLVRRQDAVLDQDVDVPVNVDLCAEDLPSLVDGDRGLTDEAVGQTVDGRVGSDLPQFVSPPSPNIACACNQRSTVAPVSYTHLTLPPSDLV